MTTTQAGTIAELQRTIADLRRELGERDAALASHDSRHGEHAAHQAATIEVLKAMSASPGDLQPVFDLICHQAWTLLDGPSVALFEYDGELVHLRAESYTSSVIADAAALAAYNRGFPMVPTPGSLTCRAILDGEIVHIRDLAAEPGISRAVLDIGHRTQVSIPLMRDGRTIGAISTGSMQVDGISDTQVALLQTFAEQAVIAIGSAETYRKLNQRTADLQESLEYQTATSDVLKVISQSTFDLQPVLDAVAETAARLCDADQAAIYRREGESARLVANFGFPPEYETYTRALGAFPIDPNAAAVGQRTLVEGRPVHVHDVAAVPGYWEIAITLGKQRTSLGVPLLRENETIGNIMLARQRVEPFTDRQIELVSTFADQAVIAIENTRLLTEQREALEQQTATAEVLQVINASAGDLERVFDTILEKAILLCDSSFGGLSTYDGEFFHFGATRGMSPGLAKALRERGPLQPSKSIAYDQIVRGANIVHIADIIALGVPFPSSPNIDQDGARTTLFVALRGDDALFGVLVIFRKEVRLFFDRQIALLKNFAAQAVIAMENARLINETREALEQQTATAEVLQVINSSAGELAPVFDAILEKAHSLCDIAQGSLELYDGERFRAVAVRGLSDAFADMLRRGYPASDNPATRPLIEGGRLSHIRDLAETDYSITRSAVELTTARTLLCVPLRRDDVLLGMIASGRHEMRPFLGKEIALLENFAAQAVVAMENARLLTEQREALEQQTATAEVLQVINASPGNLTPVFDAIAATRGLSSAYTAVLQNYSCRQAKAGYALDEPSPREQLLNEADLVHLTGGAIASGPIGRAAVEIEKIRTVLFVPLRRDGTLLGYITACREEESLFSEKQIAVLQNFAAQAVIAMENARLLTEQREALEQQTATAEVLQVINTSPGNLVPVFEAMLDKAIRLCDATYGHFRTYDGEGFPLAAVCGAPSLVELHRQRFRYFVPGPHNPISRFRRGERLIHISDTAASEAYRDDPDWRNLVDTGACRSVLAVALRKDTVLLGYISVCRQEVRPFSDKQIALLENFAAQAVIAMENARLLDEIRQRQEELRITFENMGDGVAMFDETARLIAWNGKFQEIFDLPDVLLEQHRTYEEHLRFLAARGDFGAGVDTTEQIDQLVASTGQPYGYERTRPDGRVIEIRRNPVPDGGFVLIFSDITERKRSEVEIRAARDAAEAALRELKAAQANLIQAEKMASLGQLTAGIAHEIKNPLNFVNNFAALSVDLLSELKQTAAPGFAALTDDQRAEIDDVSAILTSNLEKITEHGKRADGIVKAMLEHSRGSSGEQRLVDLNVVIDEALNLAYHGARAQDQSFKITLERVFGEGIAPIEVNPQDVTRVFLNLFSNGFYATSKRYRSDGDSGFMPTLKVTTRDAGEAVEIRVWDNGTGIPADIRDKLFQPFFTTKPTGEGTGLGLSITYDIVTQQHGGSIAVDSEVGEYSEFTIRLPRTR